MFQLFKFLLSIGIAFSTVSAAFAETNIPNAVVSEPNEVRLWLNKSNCGPMFFSSNLAQNAALISHVEAGYTIKSIVRLNDQEHTACKRGGHFCASWTDYDAQVEFIDLQTGAEDKVVVENCTFDPSDSPKFEGHRKL